MRLKFTKMQGAGNDFVVVDGVSRAVEVTPERARLIADRHFGVGCDQVLLVEKPRSKDADFRYRIWNADGGEVEQCGNGARCFMRFVHDKGLTNKNEIRVETLSGIIVPRLESDGQVTVDMGEPLFDPERVPFDARGLRPVLGGKRWPLDLAGREAAVAVLSMGNPHAVQTVADVDSAPVTGEGPLIERHPRFPQRVNAGYMEVLGRTRIRARVWERGAGETLACGTGACAIGVISSRAGKTNRNIKIDLPGGQLGVRWGADNHVYLTGPAEVSYEGQYLLNSSSFPRKRESRF